MLAETNQPPDSGQESVVTTVACEIDAVKTDQSQPHDISTIFLTYLQFLGDVEKTAAALNIVPMAVDQYAKKENWRKAVDRLLVLRESQGADALAREINRVTNYVQSVRLRNVVDRVILRMTRDEESFTDFLTLTTKGAANRSCKAIAELVKAAQMAQQMSYVALGDTSGERIERDEEVGVAGTLLKRLAEQADGATVTHGDATSSARAGYVEISSQPVLTPAS